MDKQTQEALESLGYHPTWIEYGLIDPATLKAQLDRFISDGRRSPEHYRYASFKDFLGKRSHLDPDTLDHYIDLAERDPDISMGTAALIELLEWPRLTDQQLSALGANPAFQEEVIQRALRRTQYLRILASQELTEEIFQACLKSKDSVVQRELLESKKLSSDQLSTLSEQGANRAIKNIARQKQKTRS